MNDGRIDRGYRMLAPSHPYLSRRRISKGRDVLNALPQLVEHCDAALEPANLRPEVVGRVSEAIREITELSDVWERMSMLGMSVHFRNSEQFRDLITREYQKYGVIVHEAGIQPD
jgi:hypothetical protein